MYTNQASVDARASLWSCTHTLSICMGWRRTTVIPDKTTASLVHSERLCSFTTDEYQSRKQFCICVTIPGQPKTLVDLSIHHASSRTVESVSDMCSVLEAARSLASVLPATHREEAAERFTMLSSPSPERVNPSLDHCTALVHTYLAGQKHRAADSPGEIHLCPEHMFA